MHAIAFLRGINLGGHTVKKDQLIKIFESVGCEDVTTFIASGNVVFDAKSKPPESAAEDAFEQAMGYAAPTFIRTTAQLKKIVDRRPFDGRGPETGGTLHIGFLKQKAAASLLKALETDNDELHVDGTTVYWHTHTPRMSDSTINPAKIEKALGQQSTFRSIKTINNILEKWPT
ncbi:MAG TPA: DUF1697 domain-containing protein [Acidimicrobiales bacterium]|nr:DUF1697 domain-containing protein [Acidimicrobiales bacterium]